MRRIYKWPWDPASTALKLPWSREDRLLLVADQGGVLTLWAEQEDSQPAETREFRVVGTGDTKPPGYEHVGSAIVGPFVLHVYAVPVEAPW